uniref:Uncharacterized protein n=1 Tax=Timema bartmani TaxID=61472 RepID=A0A7R9F554_9NEOP|nr:unnamed protein product [Timema bartmani]
MAVQGYGACVLVVSLALLQVHLGLGLIKEKRRVKNHSGKTTLITLDRDSNFDLPAGSDWPASPSALGLSQTAEDGKIEVRISLAISSPTPLHPLFPIQSSSDPTSSNRGGSGGYICVSGRVFEGFQEAGVLPLDPLHVTEISILQGNDGPVAVNASLTRVVIRGLSAINVTNNKVDYRTFSFTTEMTVPKMRVEGNYTLQGKILLLPLVGKGNAWFEPYNMKIRSHHDIVLKKKEGQIIFDVRDVTVTFDVSNLKMRLNNLYNGRKALEDSTNDYINANWRAVSESLKPILEKTCSDVVFTIMKNLFDNTPAHWYIGDAGVE